jgi:hypothetical protein
MRHRKLIALVAVAVVAVAILIAVALASGGPATSTALEPSPAPSPSAAAAPPAWLLEEISQEARSCGDPRASAWWTLTTAQKAHVVEDGDDPGSVTDPGRPVYVYILHGDFTRWIWSLPAGTAAPKYSWVVAQIDAKSRIGDMAGNSDKPFDTTGLAMQSVVLTGQGPSPAPSPAAGN